MKKLIFLSLIIFVFLGCQNKNKSNDELNLPAEIAKRNIQFLNGYEYLYKFGELDRKSKFLITVQEFDKKGNLIKELKMKRPDSIKYPIDSTLSKYDEKGNLIERTFFIQEMDFESLDYKTVTKVSKSVYKYDSSNHRIQLDMYTSGKLDSKTMYKYEDDNVISYVSYNEKGVIDGRAEYKYDGKHQIRYTYYEADNKVSTRSESIWEGNVIKSKDYNEKDSVESTSSTTLDNKERMLETEYKQGDYYVKSVFGYNSWGLRVTMMDYKIPSEPESKTEFEIVEFKK